jgi:CRISPR-associated protein Csd1
MILQALVQLAENEKLIADPDFEFKPVSWVIRLKRNGELAEIEDVRTNLAANGVDKRGRPAKPKWVGQKMLVPIQFVRTSGDAAYFAVDKADYVFGATASKAKRMGLFYSPLEKCGEETRDPSLKSVATFGQHLAELKHAERIKLMPKDLTPGDLIAFRVSTDEELVHDRPSAKTYWKAQRNVVAAPEVGGIERQCLITGKVVTEVPLFRKVKNAPGDTSGGLSLVSFNASAWESYGWSGENNAPVSREPAEAAMTALSRLLDSRPVNGKGKRLAVRRIRIGDDTAVVFWSPSPEAAVQNLMDLLPDILDPSDDVQDVGALLRAVQVGMMKELKSPADFFAMTLTSVTGRIVVRDWLASSVTALQENLKRHFTDLDCVRNTPAGKGKSLHGVLQLDELMNALAAPGRDAKIPMTLAADFVHAAMQGTLYPAAIVQRALLRERAEAGGDEWLDHVRRDARAAMLKAVLNRRRRLDADTALRYPEVKREMDPSNTNIGYNLGALLAVLERLQAAALDSVNATIVDKYFNAASATPRNAFDRLLRSARHHARKAQDNDDTAGLAFTYERLIDELVSRISVTPVPQTAPAANPKRLPVAPAVGFPLSLDLEQQGLFVIGYHHMRRFLWMNQDERAEWQCIHPNAPAAFLRKRKETVANVSAT